MSFRLNQPSRAFTLLELLVVVALIAGLATFFLGRLSSGSGTAGLASAQVSVANLISVARTRAMATGQSVRLLVNIEPSGAQRPLRFLRYLATQSYYDGEWRLLDEAFLPEGVYVLPGYGGFPDGLIAPDALNSWTNTDGSALRSTVFQAGNTVLQTIDSTAPERYIYFSIAAAGTTAQAGQLVLAQGRLKPSASLSPSESPVQLNGPALVRGLKLSQYGVTTLVANRQSF